MIQDKLGLTLKDGIGRMKTTTSLRFLLLATIVSYWTGENTRGYHFTGIELCVYILFNLRDWKTVTFSPFSFFWAEFHG